MNGWELLLELVAVLAAAFLVGALFERWRLGAVIGYIVGGVLIGPSAFGVVGDTNTVAVLAELGIALVLFSTGLEFSILRLRKLGRSTLLAGVSQIIVCMIVFSGVGFAAGASWRTALAAGAVFALSSTAIVLRILRERGELDASHGKVSFGTLLLQDIALVPLVLLVTLLGQGSNVRFTLDSIVPSVGGFLAAALVFIVVVTRFLPKAFRSRAMATNRELPVLLGIVTCAGSAWAAHSVGISPSLGAFLAGVLLAETSFEEQIRSDMAGFKAVFGTLFFASVGMAVDTRWVASNWTTVVLATLIVLIVKIVANFVAIRLWKRTTISSLASALTLAQVGELGFILVQIALVGGLFTRDQSNLLVATIVMTMLAAPTLIAVSPRVARRLAVSLVAPKKLALEEDEDRALKRSNHFVVFGFGTAGKTVVRILGEAQYEVLAVDVDPKFARQAVELGAIPKVGDVTQVDMHEELGLRSARALVVAIPDHRTASLAIAHARRLAPDLVIVARSRYHQFQDELKQAGASMVIGEEQLLGRRLGEEACRLALGHEDSDVREAD